MSADERDRAVTPPDLFHPEPLPAPPADVPPRASARLAGTIDPPEAEGPAGILLVDDQAENLAALEAVLEPLGERLVTARSGEQALRALLHEEIAVILLDVRMAGLDGLQTAQIIRSRPRTRRIPIIFLTAQASEVGEIALAYATGAVDYVTKPFEPEILRAKVSVFVELSRERAERVRQSRARAQAEAVARTVRTLQILSDAALVHLDLDGLAAELLDRASALFQAEAAGLLLSDGEAPGLRLLASQGAPLPIPASGRVSVGKGTLGRLAAERRSALLREGEIPRRESEGPDEGAPAPLANLLVVPLETPGKLLGLLLLGAGGERRFDAGDLELLALAADRMAIAIDHAQRFADGRELVETLQRSLLPERLPRHPRLELAARYLPSGLAPQIGGDWYDALELDRERTAVMIGDVVGHGIRAATTMGELRNALRAFAVEGHSPAAALHQLDHVVHATLGPGMVATVLFLVIDAAQGTVTLARAGHPAPALRTANGRVCFLDTEGTLPLGVDDRVAPGEASYAIEPGDTLLLYTDGLIEQRRESISVGFERLRAAMAGAPTEVEALCDHVVRGTIAEYAFHDDVALLAVRLLGHPAGSLELTLPSSADSVPLARHRLRDWLAANVDALDPVAGADLELACSEACTNAVRHADAPQDATFSMSATLEGTAVLLEIRDRGSWRRPSGSDGGLGLPLMHQVCDDVEIDRRSDGTTVRMRRLVSR
jgi:serine phosphatase RsbU (regulator of sigma subunit)/CheY-like chemotaxis protein/anti-sigma regulatory factor (Ser/Thr protein kinase)